MAKEFLRNMGSGGKLMGLRSLKRLKAFFVGDFYEIILGSRSNRSVDFSDPEVLKQEFIRAFSRFKYWKWDPFNFTNEYTYKEIEKESPKHVFYNPSIGTEYPNPSIVFYKDSGSVSYSVEIYDIKNPSDIAKYYAKRFKMSIKSTENIGDNYKYSYTMTV